MFLTVGSEFPLGAGCRLRTVTSRCAASRAPSDKRALRIGNTNAPVPGDVHTTRETRQMSCCKSSQSVSSEWIECGSPVGGRGLAGSHDERQVLCCAAMQSREKTRTGHEDGQPRQPSDSSMLAAISLLTDQDPKIAGACRDQILLWGLVNQK